jgi:hypothetical protein
MKHSKANEVPQEGGWGHVEDQFVDGTRSGIILAGALLLSLN